MARIYGYDYKVRVAGISPKHAEGHSMGINPPGQSENVKRPVCKETQIWFTHTCTLTPLKKHLEKLYL